MSRGEGGGRKVKHAGGARAGVVAYIARGAGTPSEIGRAIGYSRSAVVGAVLELRKAGAPNLDNVLDGLALYRDTAVRSTVSTERLVEQALATRSPLEEAWHA